MSSSENPSGMANDTVPVVQYPAAEEKQRHHALNVQSASRGQSAHPPSAASAPALPPRHMHSTGGHISADHTEPLQHSSLGNSYGGTVSSDEGLADGHGHHAHHGREAGRQYQQQQLGLHESEPHRSSGSSHPPGIAPDTGGKVGQQGQEAVKSAYHVLHGGMEMLRGTLLGLGDTAGDAVASRSHNPNLTSKGIETDREVITRGKAEFEKGLGTFKA